MIKKWKKVSKQHGWVDVGQEQMILIVWGCGNISVTHSLFCNVLLWLTAMFTVGGCIRQALIVSTIVCVYVSMPRLWTGEAERHWFWSVFYSCYKSLFTWTQTKISWIKIKMYYDKKSIIIIQRIHFAPTSQPIHFKLI